MTRYFQTIQTDHLSIYTLRLKRNLAPAQPDRHVAHQLATSEQRSVHHLVVAARVGSSLDQLDVEALEQRSDERRNHAVGEQTTGALVSANTKRGLHRRGHVERRSTNRVKSDALAGLEVEVFLGDERSAVVPGRVVLLVLVAVELGVVADRLGGDGDKATGDDAGLRRALGSGEDEGLFGPAEPGSDGVDTRGLGEAGVQEIVVLNTGWLVRANLTGGINNAVDIGTDTSDELRVLGEQIVHAPCAAASSRQETSKEETRTLGQFQYQIK